MESWVTRRVALGEIRPATERNYISHTRRFAAFVGEDTPIGDIDVDLCEAWIASMRRPDGSPMKVAARNTTVSTIRSFFAHALLRGWIDVNPWTFIRPAKIPKRAPKNVPPDQLRQLLAAAPMRERTWLIIILQCGLRSGELAGLQVSDWDRDNAKLRVIGKGDKERRVTVTCEATEALEQWLNTLPDNAMTGPMFPSPSRPGKGIAAGTITKNVGKIASDLGLHIWPHRLRHTMATDALQGGATLSAVKEELGHETEATTSIYLSITDDQRRDQLEGRRYRRKRGSDDDQS